jgi:hypothetical protein
MLKHRTFRFFFVVVAIIAQACAPSATQGLEALDAVSDAQQTLVAATAGSIDPVTGAKQTLAAATQQSLTALAIAQETIAAANPLNSGIPFSIPLTGLGLSNDPSIEANFTGQVVCSQFEINLTNGSTTSFKSISISISLKGDPSSLGVTTSTNGFLGRDSSQTNTDGNCEPPALLPNLDPGASYSVFFPKFVEKEGSAFEGTVLLCPEINLGGQCSKNSIVFAPIIEIPASAAPVLSTEPPTTENTPTQAPPPLAPEVFTADYVNTVRPSACTQTQTWWVRVSLTNKSKIPLKSVSISVKDTATGDISSDSDEHKVFVDLDQSKCNPDIDVGNDIWKDDLEPDQTVTISSGVFRKDPTEHPMEATITLCTDENLGGQCSTKTINFTPGISTPATGELTAYIILSAGTNCRTGPGTEYDVIGAYEANKKIFVLGKDPAGKYWVVASPYKNDTYPRCWLDGRFVKESGNLSSVQADPVPPTPTSTPKPPTATPTVTSTFTLTPTP